MRYTPDVPEFLQQGLGRDLALEAQQPQSPSYSVRSQVSSNKSNNLNRTAHPSGPHTTTTRFGLSPPFPINFSKNSGFTLPTSSLLFFFEEPLSTKYWIERREGSWAMRSSRVARRRMFDSSGEEKTTDILVADVFSDSSFLMN